MISLPDVEGPTAFHYQFHKSIRMVPNFDFQFKLFIYKYFARKLNNNCILKFIKTMRHFYRRFLRVEILFTDLLILNECLFVSVYFATYIEIYLYIQMLLNQFSIDILTCDTDGQFYVSVNISIFAVFISTPCWFLFNSRSKDSDKQHYHCSYFLCDY